MAAKLEKTCYPGIYKRGSRYVIVWEHRGRQHKESFGSLAEAREGKGRRQAGERRPISKIRFDSYFEQWIKTYAGRTSRGFSETTRPEYERPIRAHALERWQGWKLAEIEAADIRQCLGEMRMEGRSVSQMKKLRAALSAMFATAVDDNLLRSNPVQGVRIPAPLEDEAPELKAKALTRAELAVLLAAIPDDWRLFFEFLIHTGLRISEAFGLRWEHVALGEHPHVKIREQFYRGKRRKLKSGAGKRELPLSPGMAIRLREHRRVSSCGARTPVFASATGTELIRGKLAERVLTPAAIAAGFKTEEVVAGKGGEGESVKVRPTVTFHTFRHTCASLLFDDGRNIKQVQEWLGHADPGFTLRTYVHLMDAGIGDAAFFDSAVAPEDGKVRSEPSRT